MENNKQTSNGLVIASWICLVVGWVFMDMFLIIGAILGHYHWKNGGSRKAFWANMISMIVLFVLYFIVGFTGAYFGFY